MDEGNQIPLWLCDFPHNFPINSAIKPHGCHALYSYKNPAKLNAPFYTEAFKKM